MRIEILINNQYTSNKSSLIDRSFSCSSHLEVINKSSFQLRFFCPIYIILFNIAFKISYKILLLFSVLHHNLYNINVIRDDIIVNKLLDLILLLNVDDIKITNSDQLLFFNIRDSTFNLFF